MKITPNSNEATSSRFLLCPLLAVGGRALGFWKALTKVFSNSSWQRCWVKKTVNVLNKLPETLQAKV